MDFEWDETKYRTNLEKRGVRFEAAVAVFDDPDGLTEPARRIAGEVRFRTIGMIPDYAMLFYQTRINAALRQYMDAAIKRDARKAG